MTTRKDRRQELRRQSILAVAEIFFARQGVLATTLDQIGAELGVTRASLYYYYKDKDDLVVAVLRKALEGINRKAAQEMQGVSDPLQKLQIRGRIHALATVQTGSGKLIASSFDLLMRSEASAALLNEDMQHIRALLGEAQDMGLIGDIDLAVATRFFYGALNSISAWCGAESKAAEDVFESVWALFLGGLKRE